MHYINHVDVEKLEKPNANTKKKSFITTKDEGPVTFGFGWLDLGFQPAFMNKGVVRDRDKGLSALCCPLKLFKVVC